MIDNKTKLEKAKEKLNILFKNTENKSNDLVIKKDITACGFYSIKEIVINDIISKLNNKKYYLIEDEIDECEDNICIRIVYVKGNYENKNGIWTFNGKKEDYFYLYKNKELYELNKIEHPKIGDCYMPSRKPTTNEEHINIFQNKINQAKKK